MTKRFGFTLAEVLITLGIIGVVAAMTMPTLINQTRGAEFRAGFKKELSVMAQAVALNQALDDWDFSGLKGSADTTKTEILSALLSEHVNVISSSTDVPANYSPSLATTDGDLDVIPTTAGETKTSKFVVPATMTYTTFNDGSMFIYDDGVAANCTESTPCYGYFDVNGTKGPNKVTTCDGTTSGDNCVVKDNIADIFPVYFYDQIILPASYAGNAVLSDKTKDTTPSS